MVITGFNTDVKFEGKVYHVQTEDKGIANPVIETLIYVGGEILTAKRSSYDHLLRDDRVDEKALMELLEKQHKRLIQEIREGRHDPDGLKPIGEGLISDRSLDEVVLDYIDQLLKREKIEITPLSQTTLLEGKTCRLQLLARGDLTGRPIRNGTMVFQLVRPAGAMQVLLQETSGNDGVVTVDLEIPTLEGRGGSVVVAMKCEDGEARWENAISPGGRDGGS